MSPQYERYRPRGELSPITLYFTRALRVLIILILLFCCSRRIPDSAEKYLAASIAPSETGVNFIAGSFTSPSGREFWPEPVIHAAWPNGVLYLDSRLRPLHVRGFEQDERFSADAHGYALYTRTGSLVRAVLPDGRVAFEHTTSAWPRLLGSENWILLYTGDQSGIAFLDRKRGSMAGSYQQFASIVTAAVLADGDQSAILGMMDGSIEKFDLAASQSVWRIQAPAGRLPVIKGLAPAPAGKGFFAVSGSQPEMLCLIDQQGKIRWQRESPGDLRTKVMVFAGENYAVTHTANEIIILELDSGNELVRLRPGWERARPRPVGLIEEGGRRGDMDAANEGLRHGGLVPSEPRMANSEGRITWVSFAEAPSSGALYLSCSQNSTTTLYRLDADGRVRGCRVIDSPWAELTLSRDGSALAVAAQDALEIYRAIE